MKEHLIELSPPPQPAPSHKAGPSWRSGGSYYISPNSNKRTWHWILGLICLILLLILFGALAATLLYLYKSPEPRTIWFLQEWNEKCKGEYNESVWKYKNYFISYPGKSSVDICNSYKTYLKANETLNEFSNSTKAHSNAKLGHTWFSDLTAEQVAESIGKIPKAEECYYGVRDSEELMRNETRTFAQFAKFVKFNDSAPLNYNLLTGSLQYLWHYNTTDDFRKAYPTVDALIGTIDQFTIRNQSKGVDKTMLNHKKYLSRIGVFITELPIDDTFLLYKDGIYTKEFCTGEVDENNTVPVFVLGYGAENINGEFVEYWEIQPVGKKFKYWGQDGIMKISFDCYTRAGLPRVIDVFDKDQVITKLTPMDKIVKYRY